MDEQDAIMEAQCIVWSHQQTLWMDEHPELMQERQAIIDAWTPQQRLEVIEMLDRIWRLIEDREWR